MGVVADVNEEYDSCAECNDNFDNRCEDEDLHHGDGFDNAYNDEYKLGYDDALENASTDKNDEDSGGINSDGQSL